MEKRYISVDVLSKRNGQDCSNNGASTLDRAIHVVAHARGQWTFDEIVSGRGNLFSDSPQTFVVWEVETLTIGGTDYLSAKPEGTRGRGMFGGNFLYSSDSRFQELSQQPIPCHDRVEG